MVRAAFIQNGRGERIRTSDPLVPNQVRYQAALRPEPGGLSRDPKPSRSRRSRLLENFARGGLGGCTSRPQAGPRLPLLFLLCPAPTLPEPHPSFARRQPYADTFLQGVEAAPSELDLVGQGAH